MRSRFLLHFAAALRLLAAVCLFGLLWPALARAQDHILERAYWTDTTGTATFEQARAARYTSYSGVLSKGYTNDVQWVRLKIDGVPAGGPSTLILRIRPVFLDKVTLFDPADFSANASSRTVGDMTSVRFTEFDSSSHTGTACANTASLKLSGRALGVRTSTSTPSNGANSWRMAPMSRSVVSGVGSTRMSKSLPSESCPLRTDPNNLVAAPNADSCRA